MRGLGWVSSYMIEEKIPLKQGLKPNGLFSGVDQILIEEKIPLKQGLKHMTSKDAAAAPYY